MKKELIICLIIIIVIIVANIITQKYTEECVRRMGERLDIIKQIVYEEDNNTKSNKITSSDENIDKNNKTDKNLVKKEVNNLEETWNNLQEKLAYYIEHDELEKVETQIYAIKGFYEIDKYDEILPEAEKCSFILKHIEEKAKLSIKNIF